MIKILKEDLEDQKTVEVSESWIIKSRDNYYGDTLCANYRKRTDDYSLSWVNESWVTGSRQLRFLSEEDAQKFIDGSYAIKHSAKFGDPYPSKSRLKCSLKQVNFAPDYDITYNVKAFVKDTSK